MDTLQKYFPDFGYTAPIRTKEDCPSPAFKSHRLHRCGYFKKYYDSDGLPGWVCSVKCVNCGREFPKLECFIPG